MPDASEDSVMLARRLGWESGPLGLFSDGSHG